MKRIFYLLKILMVVLLAGVLQQSCTKLDEEVYSDLTGEKFFADPDNLIYAFGAVYTNMYTLVGHKFGMVGKECGTDLLVVPQRGGDWFDGGEWHRYHRHTWTPEEGYVSFHWNKLYEGITTCNQLLLQFEALEINTDPAKAELRALRALYYYWLIDLYGNVPIVDRFDVPADFKPATNTRQEVFNFIEAELTDPVVMDNLSRETGFLFYSRVNYYAAYTVLAKLYLNAEVYTGTARWQDAMAACDTIINANVYSLEGDFFNNFAENATSSPEHILGVPFDNIYALGFEVHLFTLHYNLQDKYGIQSATWNGICAQQAFFNSFDSTDIRRDGLLSGPQYDAEGNQIEDPSYEKFDPNNPPPIGVIDPDGPGLNLTDTINMLEPNCLRQAGTRVAKFPYIEGSDRYTSNDFPILRYADVRLMKAELLLRTDGDIGEALNLVNEVRTRAGVDGFTELNYENLLAERGRELYAEGHRRSDMIRFGVYLNTRWEKDDVSPDHVTLWPIPKSQTDANPNLIQNPGY
jgi:hypothetical protein